MRGPRRLAVAVLALAVAAAHVWLADDVLEAQIGDGDAARADSRPRRMEVSFVRELAQAAPPAAAPLAKPRPPRTAAAAALPAAPAASAALAASAPEPAPAPPPPATPPPPAEQAAAALPEPPASAPAAAEAPVAVAEGLAASAAAAASAVSAASAASAPATAGFDWPPSTRLAYTLTGNVRGPVDGQAQVEWLRSGMRYQVHLDLSIGPSFAPLGARRLSSDGDLGETGLQPRRYDEETRVAFREPRRLTVFFDADRIRFANGKDAPKPPGAQDTASQFVQLTWLFTTQPQLLQVGQVINIPLALPRYLDNWAYEVVARETLSTPVGPLETVHVKPRREPRPGQELTAEMWIAPSLQYLPVRIVIHQDKDTFLDMLISRLPLQSGR